MTAFRYDQTFEGLLTALFDAYSLKTFPDCLLSEAEPLPLFHDAAHTVATDAGKSERVWRALQKKLSARALNGILYGWLSELPEAPLLLLRVMKKAVDSPHPVENDFADPDILAFAKLHKKVSDERYRALQFMRFQKTAEGIYFGVMEPVFNVFPLIVNHFQDRFADQPWLIYDARRKYGYYYDRTSVREVTFAEPRQPHLRTGRLDEHLLDSNEKLFQQLWKSYFRSVSIKERTNPVKQRKDMPVRYWKYLPEKGKD